MEMKLIKCTDQMIHCRIYIVEGRFKNGFTAVYTSNKLNERKILWKDLEIINKQQQGTWCIMVDI